MIVNLSLIGNGSVTIKSSSSEYSRGIVSFNGAFKLIKNLRMEGFRCNNTYQEILQYLDSKGMTQSLYGGAAINIGRLLNYENESNIVVDKIIFENNNSTLGGAMSVVATNINIFNCTYINNFATLTGGALFSFISNINIDHSVFKKNKVVAVGEYKLLQVGSVGGAVYIFGSSTDLIDSVLVDSLENRLKISNSYFEDNLAVRGGGAVYMESVTISLGTLNILNTIFRSNSVSGNVQCESAVSCTSRGGAVYASAFGVILNHCKFFNNSANSNSQSLVRFITYLFIIINYLFY